MATMLDRSALTDGSLFDSLDDLTPVMVVNGQTADVFPDAKAKLIHTINHLCRQAMERGYDFVIVYDPIQHRLQFGDELSGSKTAMRTNLQNLGLRLLDTGGKNLMEVLLNDDITSLEAIRAHQVVLRMVERAMAHENAPKICLLIDDAQAYVQQQNDTARQSIRPEEIEKFTHRLQMYPGNHLLLIDKCNAIHLDGDVQTKTIRGTTAQDVQTLLGEAIDTKKHPDLLSLAQGVPFKTLRQIVGKHPDNATSDALLTQLRSAKEASIMALAGGVVSCRLPQEEADRVAMHPGERAFWLGEAELLRTNALAAAQGTLLVGPPGTGKSLRARYLARQMGIPYLELVDAGSEGLRGVKLRKYQQAFHAAIHAKPCVLFIDELDKEFPNTEQTGMRSNDDAEVAAYVQRMIGSPEMQGVYIVGATNNPENLNAALLRSGRFGNRLAVLAPETPSEKNMLLGEVLRSLSPDIVCTDEYLSSLTTHIPDGVAGSDYRELVRRAHVRTGKTQSLHAAILKELSTFNWTTVTEATEAMKKQALAMDTVGIWRTETDTREIPVSDSETRLAEWEQALREREKGIKRQEKEKDTLEKKMEAGSAELATLTAKIAQRRQELAALLQEEKTARQQMHGGSQSSAVSTESETDIGALVGQLRGQGNGRERPLTGIPDISHTENMRRLGILKKVNQGSCNYDAVGADGIINVRGSIEIHDPTYTELPHNLRVHRGSESDGLIDLSGSGIRYAPYMWAIDKIDLSDTPVEALDPRIGAPVLNLSNTRITNIPFQSATIPLHGASSQPQMRLRKIYLEHTNVGELPETFDPGEVFCSRENKPLIAYLEARGTKHTISFYSLRLPAAAENKCEDLVSEKEMREILGAEHVCGREELEATFGKRIFKGQEIPLLPRWMVECAKEEKRFLRLRAPISVKHMLAAHKRPKSIWDHQSRQSIDQFMEASVSECYWSATSLQPYTTTRDCYSDMLYFLRYMKKMYGTALPEVYRKAMEELIALKQNKIIKNLHMRHIEAGYTNWDDRHSDMIIAVMEKLSANKLMYYTAPELIQDTIVAQVTGKGAMEYDHNFGSIGTRTAEAVIADQYNRYSSNERVFLAVHPLNGGTLFAQSAKWGIYNYIPAYISTRLYLPEEKKEEA